MTPKTPFALTIKSVFTILISILVNLSVVSNSTFASSNIVINTGSGPPFISLKGGGYYNEIVKELFSRLNINAKTIPIPAARSMINANSGIDDGVIARIKGMEKKYKNLIRIPGKIVTFSFVAYSLNNEILVTDWNSLKPYSVGIIRGWRIYEINVVGTKNLTTVSNPKQLFNLLLNERSDLILYEGHRGKWWNKHLNAKAHIIGKPITKKEMFLYMNKKHTKLIPQITKALHDMKKDGTFNRIKQKMLQ